MGTNTNIIDYTLYDFNNKRGKVPFLDDPAQRALLEAQIIANLVAGGATLPA